MADKAHVQTEETLDRLLGYLNSLYDVAYEEIEQEAMDLLEEMILSNDNVSQWQRMKQANKNKNFDKLVFFIVARILATNEKALNRINKDIDTIYNINKKWADKDTFNKTGIKISFKRLTKEKLSEKLNRYDRRAYDRLKDRNHVSDTIIREVKRGIKKGEGIPEIARRIEKITNRSRESSILVARTESIRLENAARLDSFLDARDLGIKLKKVWNHSGNVRDPRDWHHKMKGQERELDEPFLTPLGTYMMYPCDPSAPAVEVCNCGCYMTSKIYDHPEAS